MSGDRFITYTLLGLILLAVGGMAWIVSVEKHAAQLSLQAQAASRRPPHYMKKRDFQAAAQQPEYDFTSFLSDTEDTPSDVPNELLEDIPSQNQAVSAPMSDDFSQEDRKQPRTSARPISSNKSVNAATQSPESSSYSTTPGKNYTTSSRSPVASEAQGRIAPNSAWPARVIPGNATSNADKDNDILASYMPKQTLQQQRALAQKLQDMSDGVDAAIARAFAPKSKREQNLEKYMKSTSGQAGETGGPGGSAATATTKINQQLAAQAQQIVGDMRRAYGDAAAGKASEIMNDFQQEMAAVLNGTEDMAEKMVKSQEVNNKYNEKLRKLNEQQAKEKMQQQLRQENEQYLKKITDMYGPEIAGQMSGILDEKSQKLLEIYSTPLTLEEKTDRLQALDEEMNKKMRDILNAAPSANGPAPDVLTFQQQKNTWEQKLKQEQEGRAVPTAYDKIDVDKNFEQKERAFKNIFDKNKELLQGDLQSTAKLAQIKQEFLAKQREIHEKAKKEGKSEAETEVEMTQNMQQTNIKMTQLLYTAQDTKDLKNLPTVTREKALTVCNEINEKIANLDYDPNLQDKQQYEAALNALLQEKQRRVNELITQSQQAE